MRLHDESLSRTIAAGIPVVGIAPDGSLCARHDNQKGNTMATHCLNCGTRHFTGPSPTVKICASCDGPYSACILACQPDPRDPCAAPFVAFIDTVDRCNATAELMRQQFPGITFFVRPAGDACGLKRKGVWINSLRHTTRETTQRLQ